MARKHQPVKTKYANIYEITTAEDNTEYLANWTQNGRQYPQKNFTKLFGDTTAHQAHNRLAEIKVLIS